MVHRPPLPPGSWGGRIPRLGWDCLGCWSRRRLSSRIGAEGPPCLPSGWSGFMPRLRPLLADYQVSSEPKHGSAQRPTASVRLRDPVPVRPRGGPPSEEPRPQDITFTGDIPREFVSLLPYPAVRQGSTRKGAGRSCERCSTSGTSLFRDLRVRVTVRCLLNPALA